MANVCDICGHNNKENAKECSVCKTLLKAKGLNISVREDDNQEDNEEGLTNADEADDIER